MKTVASISFRDNHSLSMDVEGVVGISIGNPIKLDDGSYFCELIVRSGNGVVALQLLGDSTERFVVQSNAE